MPFIIFLALIALAVIWFVMMYNGLVQLKHNVARAWSNIDVLLKQRHDELPKLVDTCKQHMQFESDTLERVMLARSGVAQAREARNLPALGRAEQELRKQMAHLYATVEAYPELRASMQFQHLLGRITQLENDISDRREYYNDSVNLNNVRVEQFPTVILANMFHFGQAPLLEFDAQQKQDVSIAGLFAH
ncbi:LemA family protein [Amantichitinum ursilacus]|uniref:LemA family protein n=1 Tax=Amantichitinum ursilacus TaxID=857265 RepID=A0A0N0XFJ1_9NEIS|nr:LemA family protein [Amantichitinum ursilacus]KPC49112.1 LemA family protein [Amantichitinum ursilacus]